MDKSRSDNTGQWCSRTGRKQYRKRRLGRVPKRLLLVILASAAATISLWVLEHRSQAPHLNLSSNPKPEPMSGVASVNTIEIQGQRIRFNGIDAPESKQYCSDAKGFAHPCGRRSAEALDAFLAASAPVECRLVDWDRYHRFVGDCRRADGVSVASWMVEHGQALAALQPRRVFRAADEGGSVKGGHVGRCLSSALGMAFRTHRQLANAQSAAARYHQPPCGRAESLFLRAAALLLANQLVRRVPMVSAQLLLGSEAGSRWGWSSV